MRTDERKDVEPNQDVIEVRKNKEVNEIDAETPFSEQSGQLSHAGTGPPVPKLIPAEDEHGGRGKKRVQDECAEHPFPGAMKLVPDRAVDGGGREDSEDPREIYAFSCGGFELVPGQPEAEDVISGKADREFDLQTVDIGRDRVMKDRDKVERIDGKNEHEGKSEEINGDGFAPDDVPQDRRDHVQSGHHGQKPQMIFPRDGLPEKNGTGQFDVVAVFQGEPVIGQHIENGPEEICRRQPQYLDAVQFFQRVFPVRIQQEMPGDHDEDRHAEEDPPDRILLLVHALYQLK